MEAAEFVDSGTSPLSIPEDFESKEEMVSPSRLLLPGCHHRTAGVRRTVLKATTKVISLAFSDALLTSAAKRTVASRGEDSREDSWAVREHRFLNSRPRGPQSLNLEIQPSRSNRSAFLPS